jgi:hypothetical protein
MLLEMSHDSNKESQEKVKYFELNENETNLNICEI